jgi:hypothetical protein
MESCDASIAFSGEVDTGSRQQHRHPERGSLVDGQLPGLSHGAAAGRVVAETSADGGPSMPLTTAETRQR